MSKHTPGPWHNDGMELGKRPAARRWQLRDRDGELVAEAPHHSDARLIAKAPELVEALRDYISAAEILIGKTIRPYEAGEAVRYLNTRNRARKLLAEIDG